MTSHTDSPAGGALQEAYESLEADFQQLRAQVSAEGNRGPAYLLPSWQRPHWGHCHCQGCCCCCVGRGPSGATLPTAAMPTPWGGWPTPQQQPSHPQADASPCPNTIFALAAAHACRAQVCGPGKMVLTNGRGGSGSGGEQVNQQADWAAAYQIPCEIFCLVGL